MHIKPFSRLLLPAAFVVAAAGAAEAQQTPALKPSMQGQGQGQGGRMAKMQELKQVQQKLDTIREKAMESKKLEKKEAALKADIDKAMVKVDPSSKKKMKRFEELREEFTAARKTGDQAKAKKLAGELQGLMTSLKGARDEVMNKKHIKTKVESFQKDLMAAMKKVNPKTPMLMARAQQLAQQLRGGMMMPPGGGKPAPKPGQ